MDQNEKSCLDEVLLQHPLLSHIDVSPRVCYNTLELHKQLADAKTPTARGFLGRQIAATDVQIDWLV